MTKTTNKMKELPKVTSRKESKKDKTEFPLDYYSYSSMSKFSENPLMFKVKYINNDRFETTTSASAILGRAFHRALEYYYGGGEKQPENEAEAIEYGLEAGMEYLQDYERNFIEFNSRIDSKQKMLDYLAFGFQAYTKEMEYGSLGETILLEEELLESVDVEWRGKRLQLPVKLKGYPDIVLRKDDKIRIRDHKFTSRFSDFDKIDGAKILQAIVYYLLVYAYTGEEPYSFVFEETKYTKNRDGGDQVREYEIIYKESDLFFEFFFRFYQDMTAALNGEQVYVPNVYTFFDNEVSIIAYTHRLDVEERKAELMEEHKVKNITELLKREIQKATNIKRLMEEVDKKFVTAKSLNYDKMDNPEKIKKKFMEHGMVINFDSKVSGSSVDLYRYDPGFGIKMSRLEKYTKDIEQVMGVDGIRVLAPIPGSGLVGVEVPTADRTFPNLPEPTAEFELAIGETVTGEPYRYDLREAPHVLVAGASGSGKSVFLNALIEQLATVPDADIHLFDPKMVELVGHKNVAVEHKTEAEEIKKALDRFIKTMNNRYKKFAEAGAKDLSEYDGSMNYKFIIIDEFGDLTTDNAYGSEIENLILRLAQKARAAGIHLVLSTQRPSTDIITGTIKANFPTKVAFRTAKKVDSQVILDEGGAEKLLGKGDMIFSTSNGNIRLQGYNV